MERERDWREWVLLAVMLGGAFVAMVFAGGNQVFSPAAWIGPALLLRIARAARSWRRALGIVGFVLIGAAAVQWRAALGPMHGPIVAAGLLLYGLLAVVPFAVDRFLTPRVQGFLSTLVFPCAWVARDFLFSIAIADVAFLGYSQVSLLPLLQVASLTGVFGVTFILTWCASVANRFAWAAHWRERVRVAVPFAVVFLGLLAWGNRRVVAFSSAGERVRVASFTVDASEASHQARRLRGLGRERDPQVLAEVRASFERLDERLLEAARTRARAGAQVVFWSEANALVLAEDEPGFLARAGEVAREGRAVLGVFMIVFRPGEERAENKVAIVDDTGKVVATYLKSHLSPGEPSVPGNGVLPVQALGAGTLSVAICADFSYHRTFQQVGRRAVGLMLDGASEWAGISPSSTDIAVFRAVENGFSLVKQTLGGTSIAVDPTGRVLAGVDGRNRSGSELVVEVPVVGSGTVYARVGDAFAWGCLAVLLLLAGSATARARSVIK